MRMCACSTYSELVLGVLTSACNTLTGLVQAFEHPGLHTTTRDQFYDAATKGMLRPITSSRAPLHDCFQLRQEAGTLHRPDSFVLWQQQRPRACIGPLKVGPSL